MDPCRHRSDISFREYGLPIGSALATRVMRSAHPLSSLNFRSHIFSVRSWYLSWPDVAWGRAAGSFQRPSQGSAGVSGCVATSSEASLLEQPHVDALRRAAAFQKAANPAPFPAGRAGICGRPPTPARRARPLSDRERRARGDRGYGVGIPTSASERGGKDVDPDTAALPVLESGEASQVLARDRAAISADTWSQPALSCAPGRFGQRLAAGKPDVTAAGRGGFDQKSVVLLDDGTGFWRGDVTYEAPRCQ